jgi:dTDP-4-amino-4,6-dideoxygalactose transaminase
MNQNEPGDVPKLLHVGAPNIPDRAAFDRLVDGIFERRWFTNNGPLVQELERQICEYLGVRHCIAVCNATVGLQLACHALDLSGEIILPAFTFVATAHAVQWERLKPVFADIDPATHNLSPASVESCITDQTSAIMGVHVWGRPCDTDALDAIADRHDLVVMYDAAHAFACEHQGRMLGNFGRCEVFSFHATKFFNTFEGGAITTNDDELAHKLRLMKNFGFEKMDTVVHLGTNGKMTEVCAAMGLTGMAGLDSLLASNRRNYEIYQQELEPIPGVTLALYDPDLQMNRQYVVVEIDEARFGASRDQLFNHLHRHRIRARRYFYPGCHQMEPYRTRYPESVGRLSFTESLCQRVLCLPTGQAIDESDTNRVCSVIRHSRSGR